MRQTFEEQLLNISDQEAEVKIRSFLQERKDQKLKDISALDFYVYLHLPAPQVDRIMTKLVKEGLVKESD